MDIKHLILIGLAVIGVGLILLFRRVGSTVLEARVLHVLRSEEFYSPARVREEYCHQFQTLLPLERVVLALNYLETHELAVGRENPQDPAAEREFCRGFHVRIAK